MKSFKTFSEEMTGVGSAAGLTGEPPVHKDKKKDRSVLLRRFIEKRDESNKIKNERGMK